MLFFNLQYNCVQVLNEDRVRKQARKRKIKKRKNRDLKKRQKIDFRFRDDHETASDDATTQDEDEDLEICDKIDNLMPMIGSMSRDIPATSSKTSSFTSTFLNTQEFSLSESLNDYISLFDDDDDDDTSTDEDDDDTTTDEEEDDRSELDDDLLDLLSGGLWLNDLSNKSRPSTSSLDSGTSPMDISSSQSSSSDLTSPVFPVLLPEDILRNEFILKTNKDWSQEYLSDCDFCSEDIGLLTAHCFPLTELIKTTEVEIDSLNEKVGLEDTTEIMLGLMKKIDDLKQKIEDIKHEIKEEHYKPMKEQCPRKASLVSNIIINNSYISF